MKNIAILAAGIAIGVGTIALTAACVPDTPVADWRDGYVPCDTPSGNTMVVGCYWDQGDQPYIVTDDGETFLIDPATGQRTYVPEDQAPWYVAPTPFPDLTLTPCAQEDSVNCYWDAAQMGNGEGTSFVNIDGTYYYPTDDEWGGVPACTPALADAGGVCHGEPGK